MRTAFRATLVLFVAAVLTGAGFRFGLVQGWTSSLLPENVRHAHSHLMYFGWATPALFILLAGRADRTLRRIVVATLGLAAAAYVSFLLYGYQSARWGDTRLPLSVMLAGLNMLAWYAWALWRRRRPDPTGLADAAVLFLLGSSLGAWGIAAVKPLGLGGPTIEAGLAHLFLGWFADGWFVLGVLALAFRGRPSLRLQPWLAVFVAGTAMSFLVSLPGGILSVAGQIAARVAGAVAAVGTLGLVWQWWRGAWGTKRSLWAIPMWCLAVKASGQLAAMAAWDLWWADQVGLRVLYLHLLLLGFVSGGLMAAAGEQMRVPNRHVQVFQGATLLVVATLLPFTLLWPPSWAGVWTLQIAAWAAPLPAIVALWVALRIRVARV